jgi:hypothetical protein
MNKRTHDTHTLLHGKLPAIWLSLGLTKDRGRQTSRKGGQRLLTALKDWGVVKNR